jgi:hypothetical protein
MRFNSYHNNAIKLESIQQINDGLIVMKHFFELNHKLLPIYFELNIKKSKTFNDKSDIAKINMVFDNYNFDVTASRILLGSDILDYIQHAYFVIQSDQTVLHEKQEALNLFLNEYWKLKKIWKRIEAN